MSISLRYPNIQGKTEAEQLAQVKSYLHQMVEQLNWALSTVESSQGGNTSAAVVYQQRQPATAQEAEDTFNSIKALIIKSADIVKAYEETIRTDFDGYYVAESDFGTYVEQTNASIDANSKGVTEHYENIQQINDELRETNAYIRRGHLYYDDSGKPVVGIEIGETSDDGAFRQYARFTAERLTFFDITGNPVAYIGAGDVDKTDTNCLYITGKAVFQGAVQFGGYKMDTADGLAFTWIGG
jgi:hypothetical protein